MAGVLDNADVANKAIGAASEIATAQLAQQTAAEAVRNTSATAFGDFNYANRSSGSQATGSKALTASGDGARGLPTWIWIVFAATAALVAYLLFTKRK